MGARPQGSGSPPAKYPLPREARTSWTGFDSSGVEGAFVRVGGPYLFVKIPEQEVFRGGVYDA